MATKLLQLPLDNANVEGLSAGDRVLVSGVVYTARDAAHQRLVALLADGQPMPIPLAGQAIYYVGPSPAPPGRVIGSAGPTTSYRMDPYTPQLLARGLKVLIGKGARSQEVKDALIKNKAVYLAAIGGAAALIARCIKNAELVAYPELGPEAILRLQVEELPTVVINDCHGGDLYQQGVQQYQRSLSPL